MNYTNGLPKGTIVMWYGNPSDIPDGWDICDGNNGTPNLKDRFIVAAGSFYDVGDIGGEEKVTLSTGQMPRHKHNARYQADHQAMTSTTKLTSVKGSGNTTVYDRNAKSELHSIKNYINEDSKGENEPHENRPPFYALYFIMRII